MRSIFTRVVIFMMMRNTELKRLRDRALYHVYLKGLEEGRFSSMTEAVNFARLSPAPRFYISARAAALYINRLEAGDDLEELSEQSRRRIGVLHDSYQLYRSASPEEISCEHIMEILVEHPAPDFFIGYEAAKKIILRERRLVRERLGW